MKDNEQQTGSRFSVEEMEEVLGVTGIRPEHVVAVNRLAEHWSFQAEIGLLNETSYGYLAQGATIRAEALMPSLKLKGEDPEQFEVLSGLTQLARAEVKVIEWAYRNKLTVDSTISQLPPKN